MRAYKRLELQLSKSDERSLTQLLRSGVQQVRVVLRSLALLQLSHGDTAPAIWKAEWIGRCMSVRGLAPSE